MSLTFTGSKTLNEAQGRSKAGHAGKKAGSQCLSIPGLLTDNWTKVWPTGRPQCIYPLLRDERGNKIDRFQVFPGSIIRKTGQYNTEIKYRNFLSAIVLNLSWHRFALTSAPSGSNMKFIFTEMWPLTASGLINVANNRVNKDKEVYAGRILHFLHTALQFPCRRNE